MTDVCLRVTPYLQQPDLTHEIPTIDSRTKEWQQSFLRNGVMGTTNLYRVNLPKCDFPAST